MTAHYSDFPLEGTGIEVPVARPAPQHRPWGIYRSAAKRGIDVFLVLLALPVIVPVMAVLMLLVARDGHSPIYLQQRIGRGGRQFTIWKLRTMVPDADQVMERYLAGNDAARHEWQEMQKLKNDPRITRIGRMLRKSSLDELPQLWNVLCGEMSLVGPRPMMPKQASLYPGLAYYALRPGITGPWQISDRNEGSFAARATFDTEYDRQLSLATDMRILMATVGVVLRGTGY